MILCIQMTCLQLGSDLVERQYGRNEARMGQQTDEVGACRCGSCISAMSLTLTEMGAVQTSSTPDAGA